MALRRLRCLDVDAREAKLMEYKAITIDQLEDLHRMIRNRWKLDILVDIPVLDACYNWEIGERR